MPFNPNIPQASDVPATSQGQLLANFQTLQTYLNLNHDNIVGGTGKHKFVTLPVQGVDPATAAGEMALYTKNVTGVPHLFLRPQNSVAAIDMTTQFLGNENGWALLPGGLILKWGKQSVGLSGDNIFAYPVGATIPVFSTVFTAQVSVWRNINPANDVDVAIRITDFSNPVQLRIYGSHRTTTGAASTTFTWLAIGI
jgi:hypothetical protein